MLITLYYKDPYGNKCVLTKLVCSREGSLQPVVLDNRAASLGIAHRPHIGHTQRVTAVLSADVLQHKQTQMMMMRMMVVVAWGQNGARLPD